MKASDKKTIAFIGGALVVLFVLLMILRLLGVGTPAPSSPENEGETNNQEDVSEEPLPVQNRDEISVRDRIALLERVAEADVILLDGRDLSFRDGVARFPVPLIEGEENEEGACYETYWYDLDSYNLEIADFDSDGDLDLLLPASMNSCGSGVFKSLIFLENQGEGFKVRREIKIGDRTPLKYVNLVENTLEIVHYSQESGEPLCCALTPVYSQYKIDGFNAVFQARIVERGAWNEFRSQEIGITISYPENVAYNRTYGFNSSGVWHVEATFNGPGTGMSVARMQGTSLTRARDSFRENQPGNILFEKEMELGGQRAIYMQRRSSGNILHTYLIEREDDAYKIIVSDEVTKNPILIAGTIEFI